MMENDPAAFQEMRKGNISRVMNEILDEKLLPRMEDLEREIQATKAASADAHKEIIKRLEQIGQRLEKLENQ